MRTLVIGDPHAHPDHNNSRAVALGKFIYACNPDRVVCMGDGADLPSLSSHDKGKRSSIGASYKKDVNSWLDFQDKMWYPFFKHKKKYPISAYLIGNHEQRIEKALDLHPELEGTISMKDLELENNWDEIVPYDGSTPGILHWDGIAYAHYIVSGVMNRPISGINLARQLVQRTNKNTIVGHNHTLNFELHKPSIGPSKFGLCIGSFVDYKSSWAGQAQSMWWNGVALIESGTLPHFYSLEEIVENYGS